MTPQYAGALRAFLSHHPQDAMPLGEAPDPLKVRGPSAAPETRRPMIRSAGAGADPAALLPLIFAQLPLEPTYRLRSPSAPGGPSPLSR